jgi:hypothetical protein
MFWITEPRVLLLSCIIKGVVHVILARELKFPVPLIGWNTIFYCSIEVNVMINSPMIGTISINGEIGKRGILIYGDGERAAGCGVPDGVIDNPW